MADVENAPKEEADITADVSQSLSDVSKTVAEETIAAAAAAAESEVKHPEDLDAVSADDVADSAEKVVSDYEKPLESLPVKPPVEDAISATTTGITQRKGKGDEAQKLAQEAVPEADVAKKVSPVEVYADTIAKIMPIAVKAKEVMTIAAPYIEQGWYAAKDAYEKLPKNVLAAIYGIAICFFGGTYVALIAAVEAYRLSGAQSTVTACLEGIAVEAKKVNEMSKKDDEVDEDNDGIPDTQQIDKKQLVIRKWGLVLRTVNPVLLSNAFGGLWAAFIGIIATLKLKFARTVALALSMGNAMKKPANRFCGKFMKELIPEEYHQWVPVIIDVVTKAIAMSIAWYLQRIMSAVQSGISGGLIAVRHLLKEANKRGYVELKDEDTMLDEVLGWGLAAFGVYFQLAHGFSIPFPFNIVLLPMTVLEYTLQWCITWMA